LPVLNCPCSEWITTGPTRLLPDLSKTVEEIVDDRKDTSRIVASVPAHPKIYHITHVRNLPQIIKAGMLWSDAKRIEMGLSCDVVGMSHIKRRRLHEIEVACHPGSHVGDYIPFYFCPRSIMLYILHKGNHPDLNYGVGQRPIVHLQSDLHAVVDWADSRQWRWAFSDRNAGSRVVAFYNELGKLNCINWAAIDSDKWKESTIKVGKQAEFLVQQSMPWDLVREVVVRTNAIEQRVRHELSRYPQLHRPPVFVQPGWYY